MGKNAIEFELAGVRFRTTPLTQRLKVEAGSGECDLLVDAQRRDVLITHNGSLQRLVRTACMGAILAYASSTPRTRRKMLRQLRRSDSLSVVASDEPRRVRG